MFRSFCLIFFLLLIAWFVAVPKQSFALSLSNASASATTSRPSPSSPLNLSVDPLVAGSSSVTVYDNTSTFLSSDSAKFFQSTGGESVTVATTSANKLTVSFTSGTANAYNKSAVLAVPITSMHTIVFTPQSAIPSGGKIIISYPTSSSSDTNQASPSASTWMFNGLAGGDIQMKTSLGTATCSWVISGTSANSSPVATCTTAGSAIPSGATVWVFIGCTAATTSSAGGSCTTQRPLLINPTNVGTRGVASIKNISILTQDNSSNVLDQSTVQMGTIESVFVVAHIDPTFSFTIDGVSASTDLHGGSYCGTSYAPIVTNSLFPTTGTEVNLGTISSSGPTYAAQKMTVRSNTGAGYAITATSSGFLSYPATGSYIVNAQGVVTANNAPVPAAISSSTGGYGINACDSAGHVNTTTWGQASPLFANPSAQYYYTLVNYPGAPSNAGDTIFSVYGARAGGSTPPGDYWQIITYNASVTF